MKLHAALVLALLVFSVPSCSAWPVAEESADGDDGDGDGDDSGSSHDQLDIDDGASFGESTSALVTGEKDVVMSLKTGAEVKVPKGAIVGKEVMLGLERPKDSKAVALVSDLRWNEKLVSAPYVVTPHGTKFKRDVEVKLPIAQGNEGKSLKVMWLEDEDDIHWKELAVPKVEGSKASFKVGHFSVLILVEDYWGQVGPGTDEPGTDGPGTDEPGTDGPDSDCVLPGLCEGISRFSYEGVWASCANVSVTEFDPATFDFAAACSEFVIPQVSDEGAIEFVRESHAFTRETGEDAASCVVRPLVEDSSGEVYVLDCESAPISALTNMVTRDGVAYTYSDADCSGSCSASLGVRVLIPLDTTELALQCASLPVQHRSNCDGLWAQLGYTPFEN